jgi:hypothetical protein
MIWDDGGVMSVAGRIEAAVMGGQGGLTVLDRCQDRSERWKAAQSGTGR